MKKIGKILLVIISLLSLFGLLFWVINIYVGGLGYLYHSENVKRCAELSLLGVIPTLAIFVAVAILSFNRRKVISVISSVLLAVSIPVTLYASLGAMFSVVILGPNGCSYTENIENYGNYDESAYVYDAHFPEEITEDMVVVDFVYFYKYVDINQTDLYLEVRFKDAETMEKYINEAIESFGDKGVVTYQNPFDSSYTDIAKKSWSVYSSKNGYLINSVEFMGDEDYRYVDMHYTSVSYSYEELTVIYNHTSIGSDIEVGENKDIGEYYPKLLERFGVEWDPKNDFLYRYVEE